MTGTKEFYELMEEFEKSATKLFFGHKVERYPRNENVPAGEFYQDGFVNQMFHAFMMGYSYSKCIYQSD